ncbi:hypothetical protein [Agrilutibacter solisilvae]|uniref:Pilus assembly protein n=1 Tax=Agrilutibacter solisilvae TaxID=2763317 RepID=A0A974XZA5_9GAMM|nr:hypothetical protein [Lysobacter solisilvae]QSX78542.1 hypothetical protein I8J32_000890 [Lysobacter solisilvae]
MTRWKASAIHLSLSALVLGLIAAFVIWRWYPPGLMSMARAGTLLLLLGGIDLVLGPLLTLLVYKQGKKSLKFDLTVIALLQVAALVFGLHTAWQSRPVFLVGSDTRFTLVYAHEVVPAELAQAHAPYNRLPAMGPRLVGMRVPDATVELVQLAELTDFHRNPGKFHPYESVAARIAANAQPVAAVAARLAPHDRERLTRAAQATGRPLEQIGVLPVLSARGQALMLVARSDGTVLGPVAITVSR